MIYFIRHGQTLYNKVGKFQGIKNIPLSRVGIKQAKDAAIKMKDLDIDIIYSSPLKRTLKTAKIINKYHKKQIIVNNALIEFDVGKNIENKKLKDLPKDIYKKLYANKNYYGEEDIKKFRNRLKNFLLSLDDSKNILLISHGGVYTQIEYFKTGKIMDVEIENCTPIKIDLEGLKNDKQF